MCPPLINFLLVLSQFNLIVLVHGPYHLEIVTIGLYIAINVSTLPLCSVVSISSRKKLQFLQKFNPKAP